MRYHGGISVVTRLYTMSDASPIPQHMRAVEAAPGKPGRSALWYSLAFVLIEFAALASSLLVTTTPWFMDHNYIPLIRMSGYGERARGLACQIVLYGDSTAVAGLDPAVIQKRTGLTACNVAEGYPVVATVGRYFPLDEYLLHNPAPKVLVTSWGPTNFQLDRPPQMTAFVEGVSYALRYDRGPWLWSAMLKEPADSLRFLIFAQQTTFIDIWGQIARADEARGNERARRDRHQGIWTFPVPNQTTCQGAPSNRFAATYEQSKTGIETFRKRYQKKGIHVIVNVSPVPECDADLRKDVVKIANLTDNRPDVYPISFFNNADIHLSADGAARYSEEVADQILALMRSDGLKTPQSSTSQTDRIGQ